MKTDIEIAREVELREIKDVAADIGILESDLEGMVSLWPKYLRN